MRATRPLLGLACAFVGVFNAATASAQNLMMSLEDRDAIARVAVAEAGNQGESGMAAVVLAILNRRAAGTWGHTIQAVVDAPHQFEPVARAGGDWRRLPAPSAAQSVIIGTILHLVGDGRLPDFVGGAQYFQNPRIVADRIAAGTAPAERLNFGGRTPVAVVGDHAFFAEGPRTRTLSARSTVQKSGGAIFAAAPGGEGAASATATSAGRTIFILSDGGLAQDLRRAPAP